ncbi:MAG TPA: DUF434 domain-containing protein [Pyrinomonadaceae bacterium]|nr:DUF434 domain-containing protein [Pyrinomonadaceae bacterium]
MSPDKRQHRGAHPSDGELFAPEQLPALRRATGELSWLLSRGYSGVAALKLVGDRYGLTARGRLAVSRAACSDEQREARQARMISPEQSEGESLIVDGFNLIITIEAAMSGGLLIRARDSCIRDLSSVHGSYRSVEETGRAIGLIGEALETLNPARVRWLLDRPVSNSGRLAQRIREAAESCGWPWTVELEFNPDKIMQESDSVVVTSDSFVLDSARRWLNLNHHLVTRYLSDSWLIDLSSDL